MGFRLPKLIHLAGEQTLQSFLMVLANPSNSYNIYHILAGGGDFLLFEHFLKKLPRDVSQALLVHQSKKDLATVREMAFVQQINVFTDPDDSPSS